MSANYLHGVETVRIEKGAKQVRVVKSAVIGLIGTAPIHDLVSADQKLNLPVQILSDLDAAKYGGTHRTGYTLPKAFDAIFDQEIDGKGAGPVVMINVFDPATHKDSVAAEVQTLAGTPATLTLDNPDVLPGTVVVKDSSDETTYVAGTDYTIDLVSGVITRVSDGSIGATETLHITYDYADPSAVVASDIIGQTEVDGSRSGLQAFLDVFQLFGYDPKLIIAPGFADQSAVSTEMIVIANQTRGLALIPAPVGTSFDAAIAGRGSAGTINFNTSSRRAYLLYPMVKVYDLDAEAEVLEDLSARAAGIFSAVDYANGYWYSPSNHEIQGITGVETTLTARVNDPTCQVNLLNEQGITTVFNSFGTGRRLWGNRNAAYPSESGPETFVSVTRTADVIEESIEYFTLQFLDKPVSQPLIDAITESVNAFLRTLYGRGAILGGRCWYDPARNEATELAAGHIVFSYDFLPPPPAERVGYESHVNIDYTANLGGAE